MINKIPYASIIYVINKRVRVIYRVIMAYKIFRNSNDVTVQTSLENCHFIRQTANT